MTNKLLRIYLQDHQAGATAGVELAKRCLSNNPNGELGVFLTRLVGELDEDKAALEDVMDRVGTQPQPVKQGSAWVAEKIGRLKLNGRLTGYSDLSRVVELEGLCIGVEGKLSMWKALKETVSSDSKLASFDFDRFIARAENQLDELQRHRLAAAALAFSTGEH